jgi:hypothetical protein
LIICLQVKSHNPSASTPAPNPIPATQPQRKQQSSRDILGLDQHWIQAQAQTIESEVAQYLSDPVSDISTLQFWQVQ